MQKTRDLTSEMIDYLEAKRGWVRNHYTTETITEYDTIEGKLKLLDVILKSNWIENDETFKLQSLGITFGDVIVQDMNFEWIEVEDEKGISPALRLPDTTLIIFPMTMISKRIEQNESIDVYELYEALKKKVNEVKHEAQ